jgi:hypothetical protein
MKRNERTGPIEQISVPVSADILLPKEAAARLRISTKTLRKLIRAGQINGYPRGLGIVRPQLAIPLSEIEAYEQRRMMQRVGSSAPSRSGNSASRSQQLRRQRERRQWLGLAT